MHLVRLGSSLRSRPPEATLAVARPLMGRLGISRVTDITRMDRLGLPVFASVRPRGQALRVHAGKGVEPADAEIGALMEAVEFAAAEPARTEWAAQPMAMGRFLAQFGGQTDLIDFAPVIGSAATLDDVLITVPCEDLRSGATVYLPAELVFMPFARGAAPSLFGWTSNGLASGNSLEEATLHGLLEVIERDALSMNRVADRSSWVPAAGLPAPFDRLVADWEALGIRTAIRSVPSEFGIACFQACLHEPARASVQLAAGSGAHLDPRIALSRAVCEAAQSRLSHVHGGRDDVVRHFEHYEGLDEPQRAEKDRRLLDRLFDRGRPMRFDELPAPDLEAGAGLGDLLADLLRTLAAAGFGQVFRYRFDIELGGLHVVKVVVPRCEDVENNPSRMGRRLFERVTGSPPP